MNLWHWLFRHREQIMDHQDQDADLVDAHQRLTRLEQKAADRERRLRRLDIEVQVRRREPR